MTSKGNLLDRLDTRISLAGAADELSVVVPQAPLSGRDATLVVRHATWGASDEAPRALESIAAVSDWQVLSRKRNRVHLRFDDHLLEAAATDLEEQQTDPFHTTQIGSGQAWVFNFIDPNTTKALHIGHLRNIAVGQSLACMAEAAGVGVTRQIRVGDYGRNMGEAMAGYLAHGDGRTPSSTGMPGDRLVGECYSRYVGNLGHQQDTPPSDAALTREGRVAQDAAECLLERWREGDEEIRQLFATIRKWVLDGHSATYDRLGVAIDRTVFESEHLGHADALVRRGLETELFRRTEDGAIVYETGDSEYERFLLVRPDGFPVQHLRYIATWSSTRHLYDGAHSVNVQGSEWRHMGKYTAQILGQLIERPDERHPASDIIYEMVISGSGVIKSSKGNAPLVDDILDEIIASESMIKLQQSHDRLAPEEVAPIVALSHFLARPVGERMMMGPDVFSDPAGAGWKLATAWATAWDPAYDGAPAPAVHDDDYRFLVVRSFRYRQLLAQCVAQHQVLPFVRYLTHLAGWFATTEVTAPMARVMRSILGEGIVTLGLHPTGDPREVGIPAKVTAGG